MTDKSYTGFGSHVVIEPQDLSLFDGDQNCDKSDPASKWHNLRLQLKYFKIKGCPEGSDGHKSIDLLENMKSKNSEENGEIMDGEGIIVVETKSCDSFHSCLSSASNTDLVKPSRENGRRSRRQFSITQSSEDEFHNQITMINAIFLNKKPLRDKKCEIKNDKSSSETDDSNLIITDDKCNFKSDQSSGDRTVLEANINCKCTQQKHEENKDIPQDEKGHQKHCSVGRTEKCQEKSLTNKPTTKSFKINRKSIYGTKKLQMSKMVSRRGHQTLLHKVFKVNKIIEINSARASTPDNVVYVSPKDATEQHKGQLLNIKQPVNEGYEIHFYEPIQQTTHSIEFFSENHSESFDNNAMDFTCCVNSLEQIDNFEDSLVRLLDKLPDSGPDVQTPKVLHETEVRPTIDSNQKDSKEKVTEDHTISDLHLKSSSRDKESFPDKQSEKENFKVLYKSETKLSDLSLNVPFEILFENEGSNWLGVTYGSVLNPVISEESLSKENSAFGEHKQGKTENSSEDKTQSETEHSEEITNPLTSAKRRRSSSRKSTLPVIEESPEQELNDFLESDYCLVDTRGRAIHLFDESGFPLTDRSGRPLRTSRGELLLKCDDNGIPIIDGETHVFDIYGRQPHEESFQPWLSPQNASVNRLTREDGRPMVLFDVEGKPLTSVSGTLLVDSLGRNLLNLSNCHSFF